MICLITQSMVDVGTGDYATLVYKQLWFCICRSATVGNVCQPGGGIYDLDRRWVYRQHTQTDQSDVSNGSSGIHAEMR